jgi:hypothetical protein
MPARPRADGVADDRRAVEEFRQGGDVVGDFDDLVIGGFDAGDFVDDGFGAGGIPAGGDEGDVEFAQIFTDEAAGIAGGAVDDDGFFLGHGEGLS